MPEWFRLLAEQIGPIIAAGAAGGGMTMLVSRNAIRRKANAEAVIAEVEGASRLGAVAESSFERWERAMQIAEAARKESGLARDEAAEARRELNVIRPELAECLRDRSAIKDRLDRVESILSHPEVAAKIRELGIVAPLLAVLLGGYVMHLLLIVL